MNHKKNLTKDFSTTIVEWGLKILHWNVSEETRQLLVQIFRFGIVGVVATFIDFLFLYFFKELCLLPVIVANTLSFTISVLYNYWASLTFVFDVNQEKSKSKNFLLFLFFSVVGLVINNMILWGLTDFMHIYYMVSKVMATIVVMVFNFVTRKKFLE